MSVLKRPSTRRQRALRWLLAASLVLLLSWYAAGYHLTSWGAGTQAMDRAAVGKTELVADLGEVPETVDLFQDSRVYLRANERAMVLYLTFRYHGVANGWNNLGAYALDVREEKCPAFLGRTRAGTEWYYLVGQVNDPEIDHVELWWWRIDKKWETWGGPAVHIDRSEFLYRNGKNYLVWQGELPGYDKLFIKCYNKEDQLLHQERIEPVNIY